jgi:hypothetical protein
MSFNTAVISLAGLERFTLFTNLPLELRFMIWRVTLVPRVIKLRHSAKYAGFYAIAAIPIALQVCRESRTAVESFYPLCFGSFLQPERIRFNFQLDTFSLLTEDEEEAVPHLFGILKQSELESLRQVAIDECLLDSEASSSLWNKAILSMNGLKRLTIVRDALFTLRSDDGMHSSTQLELLDEPSSMLRATSLGLVWPEDAEKLPETEKELPICY